MSSGLATFTDLQLDTSGAYVLRATASIGGGSQMADSASFTVVPGKMRGCLSCEGRRFTMLQYDGEGDPMRLSRAVTHIWYGPEVWRSSDIATV